MLLKYYLFQNNITKTKFAHLLGVSRVSLNVYINHPEKTPYPTKLAIEYLTTGLVNREKDWGKDED